GEHERARHRARSPRPFPSARAGDPALAPATLVSAPPHERRPTGMYDAFSLDFGNAAGGDRTHSLVIVPQRAGDGWSDDTCDPTFGDTFRSGTTGGYETFFDLLDRLRGGDLGDVLVDENPPEARVWINRDDSGQGDLGPLARRGGLFSYARRGYGL